MKKLMILAAMLAMVLVAAAPAIAQVEQEFDQDTESGDVDQSFTVTGGGSNGNQCANVSGVTNTGNAQNSSGTVQQNSDTGDSEQEDIGSNLEVNGGSSAECKQEVNQAAAASSPEAAPAVAPAPASKATPAPKVAPAPAPAPAPAVKAETPKAAAAPKAEVKAETPKAAAATPAPAPKAEVKANAPQAKAAAETSTPKAEAKKAASPKQLPATGGGASLFALGAGILLVAGGLLARKLVK